MINDRGNELFQLVFKLHGAKKSNVNIILSYRIYQIRKSYYYFYSYIRNYRITLDLYNFR